MVSNPHWTRTIISILTFSGCIIIESSRNHETTTVPILHGYYRSWRVTWENGISSPPVLAYLRPGVMRVSTPNVRLLMSIQLSKFMLWLCQPYRHINHHLLLRRIIFMYLTRMTNPPAPHSMKKEFSVAGCQAHSTNLSGPYFCMIWNRIRFRIPSASLCISHKICSSSEVSVLLYGLYSSPI